MMILLISQKILDYLEGNNPGIVLDLWGPLGSRAMCHYAKFDSITSYESSEYVM